MSLTDKQVDERVRREMSRTLTAEDEARIDHEIAETERLAPMPPPATWERCLPNVGGYVYLRRDNMKLIFRVEQQSDGDWIHVSFSRRERIPSWQDVRHVKDHFIGRSRKAVIVLPPEDEYVNDHPYCLHLWSRVDGDPLPDFRKRGGI